MQYQVAEDFSNFICDHFHFHCLDIILSEQVSNYIYKLTILVYIFLLLLLCDLFFLYNLNTDKFIYPS